MFTKTKILLLTIFFIIVGLLVAGTLRIPDNFQPYESEGNSIAHPAEIKGQLNGCGDIFDFRILDIWYGTIPEGYDKEIPVAPMNIPVYGYMAAEPFDSTRIGVYPKTFEGFDNPTVLRALWEGITVIWYDPELEDANYQELEIFATQRIQNGEQIMMLPFNIKNKSIPFQRGFAFSTWGVSQSCAIFDYAIFDSFQKFAQSESINSDRNRNNPPVAPLDADGLLRDIIPM